MFRATAFVIASLLAGVAHATDAGNPLKNGATWDEIRFDLLGDAPVADGAGLFDLEAPYRANDAATVPIVIRQTNPAVRIDSLMLVIDENPSPVAADISFGDAMQPLDFELRVRINQYSNVRAVAKAAGKRFMSGRYVKASGGCSAPATRDPDQALANMGQMRVKLFGNDNPRVSVPRREAQIMIRHPNYSGLQRDQLTQLFIVAHFLDRVEVFQGDERLFLIESGISISENPVFRFGYSDNGSGTLRVRAHDTEGNTFEQELPKNSAS
jgi:sulfur-oxidizing protein SoxY